MNNVPNYECLCTYSTVCNRNFRIYDAETKEEAVEKAKEQFDKWNKNWIRDGGNPKELIRVEVIK